MKSKCIQVDSVVATLSNETSCSVGLQPQAAIEAPGLPSALVMDAGYYRFHEDVFDCRSPGVYRFSKPQVENQQRIVLDPRSDLNNARYFSLVSIRGNRDDRLPFKKLIKFSTNRLLSLTCGPLASFVSKICDSIELKTRIISTHTLEATNSYNNGHTLLEIWAPDLAKYVAVDVDKKCFFKNTKNYLNAFELCSLIFHQEIFSVEHFGENVRLDSGGFVDPKTGFDYQFLELSVYCSANGFEQTFRRLCNVPYLSHPDGKTFCAWNEQAEKRILEIYPDAIVLSSSEFSERFYGK